MSTSPWFDQIGILIVLITVDNMKHEKIDFYSPNQERWYSLEAVGFTIETPPKKKEEQNSKIKELLLSNFEKYFLLPHKTEQMYVKT